VNNFKNVSVLFVVRVKYFDYVAGVGLAVIIALSFFPKKMPFSYFLTFFGGHYFHAPQIPASTNKKNAMAPTKEMCATQLIIIFIILMYHTFGGRNNKVLFFALLLLFAA